MESFLFKRLNRASRDKDITAIKTLGPYAVAASCIINGVQSKRLDKIVGKFVCYRGIALTPELVKEWSDNCEVELDGYISCSLDKKLALYFAN